MKVTAQRSSFFFIVLAVYEAGDTFLVYPRGRTVHGRSHYSRRKY
jgi:hypothetical protein